MVVVIVILLLKLFSIFSFIQFCSTSVVFFFLFFFFLINVVGLNNHQIPWPGPQDYNYPVARWFFVLGLFRSKFQTIEESAS